eukprot:TRINITY_DN1948_c0_g1_i1.p1 TRINITY_DN1948_c0_g1~~TRINITY_DN1948_c0_g1_i1.p1  ORF type:complete len:447 (+),score=35.66 TRINITY_DN1948_c0_g1_i1:242-1582(+)
MVQRRAQQLHQMYFSLFNNTGKALVKNGRNWSLLKQDLPHRSIIQIRAHLEIFYRKVKKVAPKGANLLEFVRGKSLEWFDSPESGCAFDFRDEKSNYDKGKEHNPKAGLEKEQESKKTRTSQRIREKQQTNVESKSKSNMNLRARGKGPPNKVNENRKPRNRRKRQTPEESSESESQEEKYKSEEEESESEESENQKESESNKEELKEKVIRKKKGPQKKPCIESEKSFSDTENDNTQGRFASAIRVDSSGDYFSPSSKPRNSPAELYKVPPPPATLLPSNTIVDSLLKLLNDLASFGHRLGEDYDARANYLAVNTDLGEYWRALQECSGSLLHIVNDIALMYRHNEITAMGSMLPGPLPLVPQCMHPMRYPTTVHRGEEQNKSQSQHQFIQIHSPYWLIYQCANAVLDNIQQSSFKIQTISQNEQTHKTNQGFLEEIRAPRTYRR